MSFGNFGSKPMKTPKAPKAPGKKPFSSRTVIGVICIVRLKVIAYGEWWQSFPRKCQEVV